LDPGKNEEVEVVILVNDLRWHFRSVKRKVTEIELNRVAFCCKLVLPSLTGWGGPTGESLFILRRISLEKGGPEESKRKKLQKKDSHIRGKLLLNF
jgi:hypothetical protein